MTNPTEAEARTATGDELNRLVHLYCLGDDLSCFNPGGSERVERITIATVEWFDHLLGVSHEEALCTYKSREGKGYQSGLEAHVRKWRAEASDYQGDMNLAIKLLADGWQITSLGNDGVLVDINGCPATGNNPAVAICRAAVILAMREECEMNDVELLQNARKGVIVGNGVRQVELLNERINRLECEKFILEGQMLYIEACHVRCVSPHMDGTQQYRFAGVIEGRHKTLADAIEHGNKQLTESTFQESRK